MLNVYDLERRLDEAIAAARVPGLALAVVRGEEVIYARGFGVTSAEEDGQPVTARTLFRIGSTTKPLTGTAVMRLVEQGKLDLDRPVRDYVDWLSLAETGAAERVTLRMLMSHTAGLATAAEHYGPRDPSGLAASLRADLPSVPFVAPVAKLWSYSNPGISLVGHVAEVAAGKPYPELMRELVFEPLGMARTTFDPTVAMTYPLAQSHRPGDDGAPRVEHRFADNAGHYPAGFAISNVLDLARFAVMHMNSGRVDGARLLRPESVAEMHRPHGRLYGPQDEAYGLTFGLGTHKGVRTVGHGGAISGYRSIFQMAPDQRVAVVILWSMPAGDGPMSRIAEDILDQLLGLPAEKPEPRPVAPNRALWPRYEGSYLGDWAGLATVRVEADRLVLDHNGETMPLEALADDLYMHRTTNERGEPETRTIGFVAETEGPVQYVRVRGATARRIDLAGLPSPDPAALARWAGAYDWDGLDTATLRVEDGRLFARSRNRGDKEVEARPVGERRFATPFGTFEVEEGDDGAPRLRFASTFVYRRVADAPT
jgi:CubicO group peptidase (beta-lactamase class C family)